MNTYILLLRGINVSGHKKIKMSDLKKMMEQIGFANIQTYIQSGNVVFNSVEEDSIKLGDKLQAAIYTKFGFEVPVLVFEMNDFKKIILNSPLECQGELEEKNAYFVLLKDQPEPALIKLLEGEKYPNEQFSIASNCVYLKCTNGYGNAKCNNNFFERKLKVQATTRNYKTMLKLLEMASTG